MAEPLDTSYFQGLNRRLSLPVLVGSGILILYYSKLLHLSAEQLRYTFYFAVAAIPLSMIWPIPFNQWLVRPVIRYLKGTGSALEAEKAAAHFPIRSALMSLLSWFLTGFAIVYYSIRFLHVAEAYRVYLFAGCLSSGLAASFVHFHILRTGLEPIRVRIAEELGVVHAEVRYPILLKLLLSFTMLIALALAFFALLGQAQTEEALRTGVLQQSSWLDTIWLIAVIVCVGGIVAYFAAYDISRHLDQIREATRRIAAGEFTHPLQIASDDEVADLARSINKMADELRLKMELLQKARDDAQEKKILLEEANLELRKLDELKSDFLANISHELKAPLVSTKGYVEFILTEKLGPVNDKQKKGLAVSRDNLNHLTRLITSLLDFSKVSSGMMKLRMKACSLKDLIESCVESISVEIRRKNRDIDVLTDVPDRIPPVYCDPDRIREVLLNLLINAEKFTPDPGTICVRVEPPLQEDEVVKVSVSDTGIGIPREHHTKIFQRFYQVDGSSTRKYAGTGLGLAIVQEILENHGSKILVESDEGKGSTFTFSLPLHRQTAEEESPRTLSQHGHRHHPSKLVEVVEDDPHVSGIIKTLLEEEGFAVIPARSAKDALAIAREHRPDLITLDIYLPDMSGFDLIQQFRSDPHTSQIPVIVLSVLTDKEKGVELGVFEYLEKPIDENRLHDVLARASDAIDAREAPLRIMVVDDDESTLEFFKDCLAVEGYDVITVQGGANVVDTAKREQPALILLDLVMPDVEGLDVLRQLKEDQQTKGIPVIILTGKAGLEQQNESILMGAEGIIAKPVELRGVVNQVKRYFGARMES